MEQLKKVIINRIRELENMITDSEEVLKTAPAGRLRVSTSEGYTRYYHCDEKTGHGGHYIKKAEMELVQTLAQKDYRIKVMRTAQQELKRWYALRDGVPYMPEEVYLNLPESRRALVKPIRLPFDEYAQKWQSIKYERKPIGTDVPEYYTNRGERVRSKSEILLANQMDIMDICYHYEMPLMLASGIVIYPDFTVLQKRTGKVAYLEHFGRMGDIEYVESSMKRLDLYADSGIYPGKNLFVTHESEKQPLNMRRVEKMFEEWFL